MSSGAFEEGLSCPTCGKLVESWEQIPGYVLTAEHYDGFLVPGTEKRVRAVGAQGPEFTLYPCGDQFYDLRFQGKVGPPPDLGMVITKILTDDYAEKQ